MGRKGKGECVTWLRAHVDYDGEGCLIWPFSRKLNGHGSLGYNGRGHRAHQFMCELVNGPRPSPKHETAHSCGRGHDACVHPQHVSWKTRAENQAERNIYRPRVHRARRFKLTAKQVVEIRALRSTTTLRELAARFDISEGSISNITARRTWRSVG